MDKVYIYIVIWWRRQACLFNLFWDIVESWRQDFSTSEASERSLSLYISRKHREFTCWVRSWSLYSSQSTFLIVAQLVWEEPMGVLMYFLVNISQYQESLSTFLLSLTQIVGTPPTVSFQKVGHDWVFEKRGSKCSWVQHYGMRVYRCKSRYISSDDPEPVGVAVAFSSPFESESTILIAGVELTFLQLEL